MLVIKRSVGVAPEVNLRNSLCAGNKAGKQEVHSGFETQTRLHQRFKTGLYVAPQKDSCPPRKNRLFRKDHIVIQLNDK